MSIARSLLCAPMVAVALGLTVPAHAANTIWPARATVQSEMISDYRSLRCPHAPPAAYTGTLQIDSKYDQRDATKSTLRRLSRESRQIRERLTQYQAGLMQIVTRFERASEPEEVNYSLACLDQWLEAWAGPGALLSTDTSSTGKAVRKWSLAAIAAGVMKVRALSDNEYELTLAQRDWIRRLTDAVIADYGPRQTLSFAWFNNHDYWAAWAVSASAMLLDRDDYLRWANTTFGLAFSQMEPGEAGDYRQLPLETARGELAVEYTHYALIPLVLLAETAEANGRPLTAIERQQLGQLVNFAVLGVQSPERLPELTEPQKRPGEHKMIWLLPFLKLQPEHPLARSLFRDVKDETGSYSQVGGDIHFFYMDIE
ncbi:MAG: poly(beta-D-mannuronate) lyase [Pseudomonadales bacterium]|nr:poly(beta-D-mannuronate) lyase [Pseudomonadales bacterium]